MPARKPTPRWIPFTAPFMVPTLCRLIAQERRAPSGEQARYEAALRDALAPLAAFQREHEYDTDDEWERACSRTS